MILGVMVKGVVMGSWMKEMREGIFFQRAPKGFRNLLYTQFLISLQVNNTQYKCEIDA